MENENKLLKGAIISFEGGEGCGKSTVIKLVKDKLETLGYKVIVTREPGGSEVGEDIRKVIMNYNMSSKTELLLFLAARCDHYENIIKPNVDDGCIVLCDRFIDSTLVYQGMKMPSKEFHELVNNVHNFIFDTDEKFMSANANYPHNFVASYYLQLSNYKIGLDRIKSANRETNRFDESKNEIHKTIKERYDYFYEVGLVSDKRQIINAEQTPEEIADEIVDDILRKLKIKGYLK